VAASTIARVLKTHDIKPAPRAPPRSSGDFATCARLWHEEYHVVLHSADAERGDLVYV
jgi:hypothetical protein